jgi:hypothetical protein
MKDDYDVENDFRRFDAHLDRVVGKTSRANRLPISMVFDRQHFESGSLIEAENPRLR